MFEGGYTNHSHEIILRGFLVKMLRQREIIHAVKGTVPFREGTDADHSNLEMGAIMSPVSLLREQPSFQHHGFMLDVTIANPRVLQPLATPPSTPQAQLSRRPPRGSTVAEL